MVNDKLVRAMATAMTMTIRLSNSMEAIRCEIRGVA